jgi:hypothetical protein
MFRSMVNTNPGAPSRAAGAVKVTSHLARIRGFFPVIAAGFFPYRSWIFQPLSNVFTSPSRQFLHLYERVQFSSKNLLTCAPLPIYICLEKNSFYQVFGPRAAIINFAPDQIPKTLGFAGNIHIFPKYDDF